MRVLKQEEQTGEIKVLIETLDDLWHLYNIILPGDIVIAVTFRRDEVKADKIRAERAEKKRMVLGIRVEKIEFHDSESRLRILGTIEEGPQDIGSHHTLILGEGESLTIRKEKWNRVTLERMERAVQDSKKPKIIFVAIETDEAYLATSRQFGVQEIATINASSSGKMYEQKESGDFYGEVLEKIKMSAEPGVPLVLLGPGFAKEALMTLGKAKAPEIFSNAYIYHTGQAGMAGIQELMKAGMGAEVIKDSRIALETKLVEEALEQIAKDGLVSYGPADVRHAAEMGAIDTLLILDSEIRKNNVDDIMNMVEDSRGRVVVVSENFEAGKKLDSIGGVAALLRFAI
ncbi:mRNA surveillance protein pelota [Candidatus Methanomassiliicoccus intestinalis]|uniref:mRNA surveillance protein pelota n=1 Tax=Candidatus Methanomassiliicoccus intestinalis TaxID=1406512 RepID=UPI0037DDCDE9